jgi:hypothetical protein
MGNNSFAPVLGRGTAIILLNGQRILIRHVFHVPALRVPLYSLLAHLCQRSCGFVGSHNTGMHVYFPGLVLSVDTSTDCHLTYEPLGKSAPLSTLHYVQPRCPPTTYPDKNSAFRATTDSPAPVLVKNDDGLVVLDSVSPRLGIPPAVKSPSFKSVVPKRGPVPKAPPFLANNIASISQHLKLLLDCLSGLADSPSPASTPPALKPVAPKLLLTLTPDEVARLIHCPGSLPPPFCPCYRSNGSNTKTHWTSEELHRALGCRRFRNYWHIIQTSLDGKWVDGGEFPLSLGSYTTIPKAPRGGSIDCEKSFFLNIVHVNIASSDCVSAGGFRYSLIFVNRATRYNWVFGLKDLSKESILLAFRLFRADAGLYARCFRCDCDPKRFGMTIKEHLVDHSSNIVAAAAGRQDSNSLVESHWKIMVHMA